MNFSDYISRQNAIYDELRCNVDLLDKLYPHDFIDRGGYIIALRHSHSITDSIEKLNTKINEIIPIMKYDRTNIHTTIATYLAKDNFIPDERILAKIIHMFDGNAIVFEKIKICYSNYLIDKSAMILAGNPNVGFFNNCDNIIKLLHKENLLFEFPWGAHITVCRFLQNGSKKQIEELYNLINESKALYESTPMYTDIGYCENNGREFKLNVYKRIKID